LIDAKTGKWRNLTKTTITEADPKFSPDGTRIAFRRAWNLFVMDLASGKETRLTANGSDTLRNAGLDWVYPEELDLGTAYWWSPDSRSILYLQFDVSAEPQYPHAALLGEKAIYEPQRYPQAGDDNPSIRVGVVSAAGGVDRPHKSRARPARNDPVRRRLDQGCLVENRLSGDRSILDQH
jgi:dipeptidyl-peptidase-4